MREKAQGSRCKAHGKRREVQGYQFYELLVRLAEKCVFKYIRNSIKFRHVRGVQWKVNLLQLSKKMENGILIQLLFMNQMNIRISIVTFVKLQLDVFYLFNKKKLNNLFNI